MPTVSSRLPLLGIALGLFLLGLGLSLPWAYVGGRPVGFDWIGPPAVLPSLLLAVAGSAAMASQRLRRWSVVGASVAGLLAGYVTIAGARAIPTMAAVREGADGVVGPASVIVLGAQACIVLAAWSTLLAEPPGDIRGRER